MAMRIAVSFLAFLVLLVAEEAQREPLIHPGSASAVARSVKSKQVVQIAAISEDQAYLDRDPSRVRVVELGGYRSLLSVPMLKHNEAIGAFNIYRQEPGCMVDGFGSSRSLAKARHFRSRFRFASSGR